MARPGTLIGWPAVEEASQTAKAVVWDGCHKIYLAMDDHQLEVFEKLGYSIIIKGEEPEVLAGYVKSWYRKSCGLKFVSVVSTNETNPLVKSDFADLIPQCYDPDLEEWV